MSPEFARALGEQNRRYAVHVAERDHHGSPGREEHQGRFPLASMEPSTEENHLTSFKTQVGSGRTQSPVRARAKGCLFPCSYHHGDNHPIGTVVLRGNRTNKRLRTLVRLRDLVRQTTGIVLCAHTLTLDRLGHDSESRFCLVPQRTTIHLRIAV